MDSSAVFNCPAMNISLASLIFTVALMTPNMASQSHIAVLPILQTQDTPVLEAPKAAFLSIDEYARKAAQDAGINPKRFLALISCESNWKEDAAGDNNKSLGILQFQKATFNRFAKKYDLESLDISDSYDQIDLAVLMIRDGYQEHWLRCGRRAGLVR